MTYYNYLGQPMPESAAPTSSVYGTSTSGGETLTAPPGPSSVTATGPNDTLIGSSGDTTFYLQQPGATVIAQPGGVNTEVSWNTTVAAPNVQNLEVNGDYNHGIGNSLDNLIIGNGRAWLYGGGGNDVLVGASGTIQTFAIHAGDGNQVIYNWTSTDQLQLTGAAFQTPAQVEAAMKQVGSDVVLQLTPSETLTFRNISLASQPFQPQQFLLPFNPSVLGKMTLDEEFNSLNLYNPSTGQGLWQTNFGGDPKSSSTYSIQANGENEIYTDPSFTGTGSTNLNLNPFSINNGVLSITAGQIPQAEQSSTWSYGYYSGMLNSLSTFQQKYGYFEVRAQMSNATGTWPAFWMETNPYTRNQEADIVESLGRTPNMDYVRAYGANDYQADNALRLDPNAWHTYGMLWTPTQVTFYLDGVEMLQTPTPASWTSPMSLVLNMAVGGWGGTPDPSEYPATMNVDYIHAYALADGSTQVFGSASGDPGTTTATPPSTTPPPTTTPPATTPPATTTPPTTTTTDGEVMQASAANPDVTGTAGADTITGWSGHDVLRGGAGADMITGGAGFNDINGNQGADTIVGHSQIGDWLSGGQGHDSITAAASTGNNLIFGNLGPDTLVGGVGADTIRGGQGDDSITAGSGADWISGDLGNNTIAGGTGADVFHGSPGHDLIMNWHAGDRVQLDPGVTYTLAQSGSDLQVNLSSGGQMILQGVSQSTLQSGWIFTA